MCQYSMVLSGGFWEWDPQQAVMLIKSSWTVALNSSFFLGHLLSKSFLSSPYLLDVEHTSILPRPIFHYLPITTQLLISSANSMVFWLLSFFFLSNENNWWLLPAKTNVTAWSIPEFEVISIGWKYEARLFMIYPSCLSEDAVVVENIF